MNVCTHTQALPSQTGPFLIPCFRKLLKPAFYQSNSAVIHSQLRRTQGVHSSQVTPAKRQNCSSPCQQQEGGEGTDAAAASDSRQLFLHALNCSLVPSLWNPELHQARLSLLCKSHEQLELSLQKRVCSALVINISIFPDELVQTQIPASKAGSFQTDQTQ